MGLTRKGFARFYKTSLYEVISIPAKKGKHWNVVGDVQKEKEVAFKNSYMVIHGVPFLWRAHLAS